MAWAQTARARRTQRRGRARKGSWAQLAWGSSPEDAAMAKLVGWGSRRGSTGFGRAGDITKKPPVWLGVAAALAVAGPRGRRAAARGGACYAATGGAQLLLKAAIGRDRPRGAGPLGLGPLTSSLPSGHAGSDLAFVLGAAQELPVLVLPLSAATLSAHWSLVRSRSHYPSDVIAGGVLGIAAALAAWLVWPPRSRRGATDSPGVQPETSSPTPTTSSTAPTAALTNP